MLEAGRKLFAKIHKQKRHANPNHDVHFMARELDDWLMQGVESFADGSYTPRYKNPDHGIALRGPLSQFFSGLYLKPLDDAFISMDVTYIRYQDDVLILCQTNRQLQRCKQRMMTVLKERRLRLSIKKTRIGRIEAGFHFLGIQYSGTQTPDNTNVTQANDRIVGARGG